jgi:hypothetical protein
MRAMRKADTKQLELECGEERDVDGAGFVHDSEAELMRRIEKVISETTKSIRPYLNRMVKDVERLLEGSFIRTPGSNVLNDMSEGLEKDIRKFVDEVKALKRWSGSPPNH